TCSAAHAVVVAAVTVTTTTSRVSQCAMWARRPTSRSPQPVTTSTEPCQHANRHRREGDACNEAEEETSGVEPPTDFPHADLSVGHHTRSDGKARAIADLSVFSTFCRTRDRTTCEPAFRLGNVVSAALRKIRIGARHQRFDSRRARGGGLPWPFGA